MRRNRKAKIPGPASGEDEPEIWESRMGIVRTFVLFATVVTSLRVGKCTQ